MKGRELKVLGWHECRKVQGGGREFIHKSRQVVKTAGSSLRKLGHRHWGPEESVCRTGSDTPPRGAAKPREIFVWDHNSMHLKDGTRGNKNSKQSGERVQDEGEGSTKKSRRVATMTGSSKNARHRYWGLGESAFRYWQRHSS